MENQMNDRIVSLGPRRHAEPTQALLTAGDVATMLQVSAAWVRDHATRKQPRLPVVRVGKLLRFRASDVERWIEEQMRRAC
jgi:excisionase family DNA binding protein